MMSTPPIRMVSVPVEDLAGKLKAIRDKFLIPTPDKDHTDYAIMTRCIDALTAAPVREEGGAVRYDVRAEGAPGITEPDPALATREEAPALCDHGHTDPMTLCASCEASSMEAPAEAGDVTADSLRSVSDETMQALLSCKDVGTGRAHLAKIINTLRAQPQAREEAQLMAASVRLAKTMFGIDLVPTTPRAPEAEKLREDAERFRALMRCGRIKMQGSSGVDPHTGERNGNNVHFGAEFWPEPITPEWEETYRAGTTWGRACIKALADAILEQEALQQEGCDRG